MKGFVGQMQADAERATMSKDFSIIEKVFIS